MSFVAAIVTLIGVRAAFGVIVTIVDTEADSPLISVACTVAVYVRAVDPDGPSYVCVAVAVPPARFPSAWDVPSPKSSVAVRSALLPVAFVIVKITVAVLLAVLACTAAQFPVPDAGAHARVTIGPDRIAIVTLLLVSVPAVALTTVCWLVVSVVRASPLEFVVALAALSVP